MIGGLWKSTSSVALFAAAGLFVGGVAMPSAKAADLGGDCCADLEERVAELEATTARKGNRRVSLTITGQVVTGLMAWDNGRTSDVYVVDVTGSGSTHFSLNGSAKINPNVTAGFELSVAICGGARTHHVNELDDDSPQAVCFNGAGDSTMTLTHANWYLDHKAFGRVTVGRMNTATHALTVIDLGGASVIANSAIGYWQRSFSVFSGGVDTGIDWTSSLGGNPVNGASLSRANAIKYTSPTMGGFSVAAAWGEDDIWDVALRYAGEMGGFRFAAGVGYINNASGTNEVVKDTSGLPEPSQWKGSASVLHVASGLYLTGAFVDQDNNIAGLANTRLWYVQGGISQNWTGLGRTVFYGEYAQVDNPLAASPFTAGGLGIPTGLIDSNTSMLGIGVVQHIDAAAMEVFLAYRQYRTDFNILGIVTVDADDFNVVIGGARIRF